MQCGNKSKAMWDVIRGELGKREENNCLEINDGNQILTDPKEIGELFNNFYTNIAQKLINNSNNNNVSLSSTVVNSDSQISNTIFLAPTTVEEITSITKSLKNKESSGLDEVSACVIKNC